MRDKQMAAFRAAALDSYVKRLCVHLRQRFPARLEETGDSSLDQLVRGAIRSAESYGIAGESEVTRYAEYAVEYGPDFHAAPWARPILTDAMTATEKMDGLDDHTTFELRN